MKLRAQTDYALRILLFLAFVDRRATTTELAEAYDVSRDHMVKVVQHLARLGMVRTTAGRRGGISLIRPASEISVREVVEAFEGRGGLLECIDEPTACVMEPGCKLRRLLISAETQFLEALEEVSIEDLVGRGRRGGLYNLGLGKSSP